MTPLLHDRFPALGSSLPHLPLVTTPSPVRELPRLAAHAGAEPGRLWVKDDARIGDLWGGNKPRKLEWVLADARRRGHRTILTFGALATNHGLATARYAAAAGLRCVIALVDQPVDDHVRRQLARLEASGARLYRTRDARRTALATPWILARHAQARPPRLPYVLPPGGSSPIGAVGFVEAGLELGEQVRAGALPEPAAVVHALGTGGTAAGLLVGLRLAGLRTRVVSVLVNDTVPLSQRSVLRLAHRVHALLEARGARVGDLRPGPGDLEVLRGWLGPGYGHRTPQADEAIALAGEDGLTLEPVYTGKTMAALLDGLRTNTLPDGPVLYWHTHSAVGYEREVGSPLP
jgi:D-cysteine desulfhydrase